jgi:hypothetical protein
MNENKITCYNVRPGPNLCVQKLSLYLNKGRRVQYQNKKFKIIEEENKNVEGGNVFERQTRT